MLPELLNGCLTVSRGSGQGPVRLWHLRSAPAGPFSPPSRYCNVFSLPRISGGVRLCEPALPWCSLESQSHTALPWRSLESQSHAGWQHKTASNKLVLKFQGVNVCGGTNSSFGTTDAVWAGVRPGEMRPVAAAAHEDHGGTRSARLRWSPDFCSSPFPHTNNFPFWTASLWGALACSHSRGEKFCAHQHNSSYYTAVGTHSAHKYL